VLAGFCGLLDLRLKPTEMKLEMVETKLEKLETNLEKLETKREMLKMDLEGKMDMLIELVKKE